jgi:hypothetical protein
VYKRALYRECIAVRRKTSSDSSWRKTSCAAVRRAAAVVALIDISHCIRRDTHIERAIVIKININTIAASVKSYDLFFFSLDIVNVLNEREKVLLSKGYILRDTVNNLKVECNARHVRRSDSLERYL